MALKRRNETERRGNINNNADITNTVAASPSTKPFKHHQQDRWKSPSTPENICEEKRFKNVTSRTVRVIKDVDSINSFDDAAAVVKHFLAYLLPGVSSSGMEKFFIMENKFSVCTLRARKK
jgi:hypothetical protein